MTDVKTDTPANSKYCTGSKTALKQNHIKLHQQSRFINLQNVIKLLCDKHSVLMVNRHVVALNNICLFFKFGIPLKDVVFFFKIMNICADRSNLNNLYIDPLNNLINLCKLPFLEEVSSDRESYFIIATQAISQLGYMLRIKHESIRLNLLSTITDVYCFKYWVEDIHNEKYKNFFEKYQQCSVKYLVKVIEQSNVIDTILKSIEKFTNQYNVLQQSLQTVNCLTKNSEVICLYAIKSDGIKIISSLLNNLSIKTDMFIAVGILWNLLGNANLNDALIHFNTLTCINELQTSFMNQLYLFHSQSERELRNDILSIITIISKFKLKNRIVDTGLLEKLCLVASFEDNNTKHPLTDRLNLKNNSQDFEMRRLILCIICNLASDTSAQSVISNSGMIKSLLHYFTNPTTIKDNKISTHSLNTWSDSMYEEIQLQSLNTIALLSNNVTFAQKFIDNNITTMLMIFLNWCTTQDGCKSFGNDFHAKGAKNTNLAHIKQALQIIRNIIISSQNFGLIFCDQICDQGLIPILIDYLNKQQTDKLETSLQIEIKYDILLILSIVCQDNSNNKIMFGNAGCDIVIHNMQLDEQKLYSGLGYYKLLIATIGALWSCVINCYGNESYFIERGGARIMMNLLEKIDKSLHNIILGCLTDLCNNPRVFTHLLSWKGKNRITAAHLFCQLWRQEETVMQVIRDENGKISDCVQPIIGKYQVNSEIVSLQSNKKSNSIIDVSDNIRSKIYAFFSRVGYQNLFGLTMTDRMTLEIIKNYLDFKKAEVLEEVEIEICREEHLEIVEEPDREILEAMKLISINKTEKIMQNQSIILKTNHQQELNQETVLYQKIMNNKMLMEESTRLWTEFVKRTSNHTYLTMMREIQLNEVKNTNLSSIPYGDLHRHETMIPNSNVTAFVGKHVKIESTPVKYLGGALNNYDSITGTMKPQPLNNQQHSKCINTSSSTENSIKYDSSTSESKVEAI